MRILVLFAPSAFGNCLLEVFVSLRVSSVNRVCFPRPIVRRARVHRHVLLAVSASSGLVAPCPLTYWSRKVSCSPAVTAFFQVFLLAANPMDCVLVLLATSRFNFELVVCIIMFGSLMNHGYGAFGSTTCDSRTTITRSCSIRIVYLRPQLFFGC